MYHQISSINKTLFFDFPLIKNKNYLHPIQNSSNNYLPKPRQYSKVEIINVLMKDLVKTPYSPLLERLIWYHWFVQSYNYKNIKLLVNMYFCFCSYFVIWLDDLGLTSILLTACDWFWGCAYFSVLVFLLFIIEFDPMCDSSTFITS